MTSKPAVIVDPHFRKMNEIFSPADYDRLYDMVDVIWGKDEPMPIQAFREALPDAVALICADWRYGNSLNIAPMLRALLTVSGGFPLHLDYQQCYDRQIRVLSAAPAFARQVAEMSLAMALAASREVALGDRAMRENRERWLWQGNKNTFLLFNQPVGFIGYGNLAQALRPLLAPFGCPIAVYDPWLSPGYLHSEGVTPMDLEPLLERSKFVFALAVPSKENEALLSREQLERLQANSVLVLMSRAQIVDFEAMTEMVIAGRFKAAIDVFPTEPLVADHPIRQAEGAVLSAHRAGSVKEGLWEIGEMVLDDLEAIIRGLPPRRMQMAEPELSLRYATNKAKEEG